jgi:hypothetical protein
MEAASIFLEPLYCTCGKPCRVTAEERAKAVVEHFASSLPPAVRPELEKVITSAIRRAVNQELAKLERMADAAENRAHGRGKSAKGHDPAAIHFHREWKERFRIMRNGARTAELE